MLIYGMNFLFAALPDDKQANGVALATAKSLIYLLNPAIRFRFFDFSPLGHKLPIKQKFVQAKQTGRGGQMSGHN